LKLVIVTVLCALVFGCDLFETRQPEDPEGARGSWEIPLTPDAVLTNLSLSLFERNAANYMRSFAADSFVFTADPVVVQQRPDLAEWNYASEQSFVNSLFGEGVLPQDSIVFVVFSAVEATQLSDTAHVTARYEFTAQVAIAGAPGVMSGEAQFSMKLGNQGYWEIRGWSDRRTEDQATWSELKALLLSR